MGRGWSSFRSFPPSRGVCAALVLTAALSATPSHADWSDDPATSLFVPGTWTRTWIHPDGFGGAILSGTTPGSLRDGPSFRVQRVTAEGTLAWGAGVELLHAIGPGSSPLLLTVPDGTGGAFFLMKLFFGGVPPGYAFWVQHVDASGVKRFGILGKVLTSHGQPMEPIAAVPDGEGGGVLIWREYPSFGVPNSLHAQRFDSTGVERWPDGTMLGVDFIEPGAAVPDGTGGVILCAGRYENFDGDLGVVAFRIDGNGIARWPLAGVPIVMRPGYQDAFRIVPDGGTGAVITWRDARNDPPGESRGDIYAQRVDSSGVVRWAADGVPVTALPAGEESAPAAAPEGSGGVYVAWQERASRADADTSGFDIYAQHLDSLGAPGWGAGGRAVASLAGDQVEPAIASDLAGGAIVTWSDGRLDSAGPDVFAQRLDEAGEHQWTPEGAPASSGPGAQSAPELIPRAPGEAIVMLRSAGPWPGLYLQRVPLSNEVPVLASLVSVAAEPWRVRLRWQVSGAAAVTVERRIESATWSAIGSALADGGGFAAFEDRSIVPGGRYGYRLALGADAAGETWVDVPRAALAFQGTSNPMGGQLRVSCTLPSHGPVRVELLDLAGRSLRERSWPALEPGAHVLDLGETRVLAPGLYFLRLAHDGRSALARISVVR